MSLVEEFTPHIPYLRRFARAITGSQVNGDNLVRTSLEALSLDNEITKDLPPKIYIYRILISTWLTKHSDSNDPAITGTEQIAKRINRLPTLSRITFLLKRLEGFSDTEISQIIEKNLISVQELQKQADKDIESELRTNILIIEDEPLIALDIKQLVEEMGHTVDCIVATHTDAVDAVDENIPGLILADIQLADGSSGIEAVIEILDECKVPVIFITAFPEKLLTGNGPEPAYLITKPFKSENVKAAISQALFFHE